jgi:hypothetical protein
MNKYEQLIEYIINDNEAKARELFHEIVVETSRHIYENLVAEEDDMYEEDMDEMAHAVEADEDGLSEAEDELEGDLMGDEDMEDMEDMGDEDMEDMGDEDMEDMGDEGLEDRVMDLEDALDELKAEFDRLMTDEANEPEHADMFGGEEDMGDEDMDMDMEMVREYVEKIGEPYKGEYAAGEGRTVGTGNSAKPTVNTKSTVAGKNDMGGSTQNIAKGGSEQAPDGTSPRKPSNYGTKGQGNLPHAGQYQNVPGAKTRGYETREKAKSGEEGAVNKKSIEPGSR